MTLAPSIYPLAEVIADLLRRTADAIAPPRPTRTVGLRPPAPKPRDPDEDRAMLSAAFRDRLPARLRRDIGIDV